MSTIDIMLNNHDSTKEDDAKTIEDLLTLNKGLSLISYYIWGYHRAYLFDSTVSWADIIDWRSEMSCIFTDDGAGFKMYGYRADDVEWRTL